MNFSILRTREVADFSAALEHVHMATDLAELPGRIFGVLEGLLPGVFVTIDEFHVKTGASRNASNRPVPQGWVERLSEIAPAEHPAYPLVMAGERSPLRLSDLVSQRELRRSALYHDVLAPLNLRHQIVLPLIVPDHVAGLTVNRDRPFTDEELCLTQLLSPHFALAHVHAQNLTALQKVRALAAGSQAGLSQREAEVLHWIGQGKRDGEIAVILGISRSTVSKHVERILEKLGVETRTAAAMALKGGK